MRYAAVLVAAGLLLGAHAWRGYAAIRRAVPDPLHEVAVLSLPLGPTTIASTIFVPDCATALVVRFDPLSSPHGDVALRLRLQQKGNRFPEAAVFQATGRLESMPDGVWTLYPPMEIVRARFAQITLQGLDGARGSLLMRAPPAPGRARPNLDERWAARPTVITGALMARRDPLACIAAVDPLPRALVLPGALFVGMVWLLTLVVIGLWLWPIRAHDPGRPHHPSTPRA